MADYKDENWLRSEYESGKTTQEIANQTSVTESTIRYWMDKFDIERRAHGTRNTAPKLFDEEWLYEQYVEQGRSTRDIAEEFDVTRTTINDRLRKAGIELRERHEAVATGRPTIYTKQNGYEVARTEGGSIPIHRLVATAEFGAEALKGNIVHHKNNVPWDNRHENLEVMTQADHIRHHKPAKKV